MTSSKQALEMWKRADGEARSAESRLLAEWELYEKRLVGPPAEDLLRQIAVLRGEANERLTIALITLSSVVTAERLSTAGSSGDSPSL